MGLLDLQYYNLFPRSSVSAAALMPSLPGVGEACAADIEMIVDGLQKLRTVGLANASEFVSALLTSTSKSYSHFMLIAKAGLGNFLRQ